MNTERAQAFLVVGGEPRVLPRRVSRFRFKFNAICETTLGTLKQKDAAPGQRVVNGMDVYRRAGVRTLAPVTLDVTIQY